jgi:hypothetical protein
MGGAMEYLSKGFAQKGYVKLGKVLSLMFAVMLIGGAIGGGNIFQVSQAYSAISHEVDFFANNPLVFGFILAGFTAIVIIGGVTRIASITQKLVPFMVVIYIGASLWILASFYTQIDDAIILILNEAFNTLLENPQDKTAIAILKDTNPKLLTIVNYITNKQNKIVDVQYLDEISRYNIAIENNDMKTIDKQILNSTFLLKEYAIFQKALIQTLSDDFVSSKKTLEQIPQNSPVSQLANRLKHYLLTK